MMMASNNAICLSLATYSSLISLLLIDGDIIVIKITSKNYNSLYDVEIVDWQHAGLLSKSVARICKIQAIYSSLIFAHIGSLNSNDIKSIKKTIGSLMLSL